MVNARELQASDEKQPLYAEQVKLLYKHLPVVFGATLVNSALLTFIQWKVISHWVLMAWFACMVLITAFRYLLTITYWKASVGTDETHRWETWHLIGTVLAGFGWGMTGVFLFPETSIIHQTFLAFVLGGMTAGAVTVYSPTVKAFVVFIVLNLMPISVRFFSMKDTIHTTMGVMVSLCMVLMMVIAWRIHTMVITSLKLRFENRDLITSLTVEKEQSEKLNAELISEIAERRRVEEALRRSEAQYRTLAERLQQANTELEAFANSISHDLRAPLRAMQGFATALLEDYGDRLDATGQNYARCIFDAARRMDILTRDLLVYSHLDHVEMQLKPISLNRVVEEVLMQLASEIQGRNAQISVEKPLPTVMGRYPILIQVVTNLLMNAMTFVANGVSPQVQIWAETHQGWMRLWIEDNGIGIDPVYHEHIFGIFKRLHGSEIYPGTGIGLAIVRKGIARLGGRVGVKSQVGQGSKFWVELTTG